LIGNDWLAIFPAALWAVSPMSVTFAVGGMETSLNIFWMVAATWGYVYPSPTQAGGNSVRLEYWIGVCAGLGLLTRIDAVLWIAPLFVWQLGENWLKHRRLPWRTWIACGLVLLPWVIFSVSYFGSPIPNSVTAKRNAYELPPLSALSQLLPTYSNTFFAFDTFGSVATMISGVLILTFSLFALVYAMRQAPRIVPFLIYPWLYLAFFVILNPLVFRWYMAPPLPALMLSAFVGAWVMLQPLTKTGARRLAYGIVGGLGLLCLFTSVNAWTLHP